LRFLSVRHLAVIDRVEVEFESGLNVLTGETGAGKSILVEALDLLAGGRASADLVRTGEPQTTVQAVFESPAGREVIVRREVSAEGRSRAFIDDTLATATALRDLGAALLSLHGQHDHRSLLDPAEHLTLLDAHAGHADLAADVAARHDEWRAAAEAIERAHMSDREKRARIDIAAFQLQEIDAVAPRTGEDEDLAAERAVLANADRLRRLSSEAFAALYDGDAAALPALAAVWKRVGELAALDPRFQPFDEQRGEIKARLEDLAFSLRRYEADLDGSPARLQAVEDRLAALERLKRRYGPSLADVVERTAALRAELDELGAGEERAAVLAARERETREAFLARAHTLTAARQRVAATLARALERELRDLAMPACRVDIAVRPVDPARATRRGLDDVEVFFAPNPGEDLRPLARIASGGELSRFMLALRLFGAPGEGGMTLIFDEVDAGIGGVAAEAVAVRLQALGRRFQVLCVSHLAQIAARADAHFEITKQVRGGRTHTTVSRLDTAGREREIGRMIAGAAVSANVLASARELLRAGGRVVEGEQTTKVMNEGRSRKGSRRGA